MNFGLEIELDADHERGILELAVGVDGTLEEVADDAVGGAGKTGERGGDRETTLAGDSRALLVLLLGRDLVDLDLLGRHVG